MDRVIKLIDNKCDRYSLDAEHYVLGRQWDNEAERIVVEKPAIEKDSICEMFVKANGKLIEVIQVYDEPIPVKSLLSQHLKVTIGFSFSRADGYVKNSEPKDFYFLEAIKPEDFVPTEPEGQERLNYLLANALVDLRWKEGGHNTLELINADLKVIRELELSGFVQEQANLAETDAQSETFVQNKSTKYLANEGDGESPYVTETGLNARGYLSEIPSEYVTEAELDAKGYATEEFVESKLGDVEITADKLVNILEDSDSIVIGTNEEGDKVNLSLDAELSNRLMKTLIVPRNTPSETELVGVDNTNSQTMIEIGDGLKLENGVLSSTATGGEGGSSVNVIDSLVSQSSTDALSARQGNVLYKMLVDSGTAMNQIELNARKQLVLGADGVLEGNGYRFTVDNPDSFLEYRTNLTKFLVDLNLPITGDLDITKEVSITFGDTSYYVFNILKGMEHATIGDLHQVDKYNNDTGYRFISEMTFFETSDVVGFAIIPTISMSDILALDSDQMDAYMADGGLTQGQLAVCKKVITNGYDEGAIYRFEITYPDTYSWTKMSTTDLTDYVKFTDYADENSYGVVKTLSRGGTFANNGALYIRQAENSDIDARTQQYRPITPANLDYAFNSVLKERIVLTKIGENEYSLDINTEV